MQGWRGKVSLYTEASFQQWRQRSKKSDEFDSDFLEDEEEEEDEEVAQKVAEKEVERDEDEERAAKRRKLSRCPRGFSK